MFGEETSYTDCPGRDEIARLSTYAFRSASGGKIPPRPGTTTATILISEAVHTLEHIRDRNHVPLPHSFWDVWLDPTDVGRRTSGDQALVDEAVRAALPVAEDLEWYPVCKVTGDSPALIQPAQ